MSCGCETSRRSVSDYFDRPCHRSASNLPDCSGKVVKSDNGLFAQFHIEVEEARVKSVRYNCATCVALVAYCERLADLAENQTLRNTITITPSDLVGFFSEIPYYRYDRAELAVRALQFAVSAVVNRV
jgi:NifU-like N terminal domain